MHIAVMLSLSIIIAEVEEVGDSAALVESSAEVEVVEVVDSLTAIAVVTPRE